MKKTIKVKVLVEGCAPEITANGDWIDLRAAEAVNLNAPFANQLHKHNSVKFRTLEFDTALIPLGVAMQLPAGYEAVVVPRSSTFKHWSIIQVNSQGVIDQTYCGPNDQWRMPVVALNATQIQKGDRVCQFRIQLSQKATFWQRLSNLFCSGIKIKLVDELSNPDRGGFGHSGTR